MHFFFHGNVPTRRKTLSLQPSGWMSSQRSSQHRDPVNITAALICNGHCCEADSQVGGGVADHVLWPSVCMYCVEMIEV